MSLKREFPPRVRSKSHTRDASLIIIATEGNKTEQKYFEELASKKYFFNSRIHVRVLDRLDTNSSPSQVLKLLDDFKREFRLKKFDELWLVIDVDRWGQVKLSDIARQCRQKDYELAVSNPAFELWLLLHLRSLDELSEEEKQEIFLNRKDGTTRTRLEREIINILGAYNKSNPDTDAFIPSLSDAIRRARILDIDPNSRWPNNLGSRVYRLAVKICNEND